MYGDTIFITDRSSLFVPREPASDSNYIKHVNCDGAHFHVLSYSTQGTHCSEPNCIINKPLKEKK